MSLADELSKPEYQTGSYAERFSLLQSKTESVVGKIAYGNTLHLVSMLARGLRARIESCAVPELKNAWAEALNPAYLASPAYSINVALPEIRGMLDAGLQASVCTADEHAFIVQLATYQRQIFSAATLRDVVAHFEPEKIQSDWVAVTQPVRGKLSLRLLSQPPEVTHMAIQYRERYEDGEWSDWLHATALHNIYAVKRYEIAVPVSVYESEWRWRCEYVLHGNVVGV